MPHVMHECPNTPPGYLESLQNNYGYPEDEKRVPMNTDAGHPTCPWCGADTSKMEGAKGNIVKILGRRPGHF